MVASPSISIKESYPSKSTRCLTIQNSSDEDGSSHETEVRSSHHSATSCSPATDRQIQSQKVTEMLMSSGQSINPRQMTKSTGHWLITRLKILLRSKSSTRHQATNSHRTLFNKRTFNKHQAFSKPQTRHRTCTELQTGHQTLYIHRTPDISRTNENHRTNVSHLRTSQAHSSRLCPEMRDFFLFSHT